MRGEPCVGSAAAATLVTLRRATLFCSAPRRSQRVTTHRPNCRKSRIAIRGLRRLGVHATSLGEVFRGRGGGESLIMLLCYVQSSYQSRHENTHGLGHVLSTTNWSWPHVGTAAGAGRTCPRCGCPSASLGLQSYRESAPHLPGKSAGLSKREREGGRALPVVCFCGVSPTPSVTLPALNATTSSPLTPPRSMPGLPASAVSPRNIPSSCRQKVAWYHMSTADLTQWLDTHFGFSHSPLVVASCRGMVRGRTASLGGTDIGRSKTNCAS